MCKAIGPAPGQEGAGASFPGEVWVGSSQFLPLVPLGLLVLELDTEPGLGLTQEVLELSGLPEPLECSKK